MSRRAARELVLHLIFQNDFSQAAGEELLKDQYNAEHFSGLAGEYELYAKLPGDKQEEYVHQAVTGVVGHTPELDAYIEKYAVGWNVGRISRISKCILRLCMYEILYLGIPVGASVNEALELAKRYDSEDAAQFINGILGSFVRGETGGGFGERV